MKTKSFLILLIFVIGLTNINCTKNVNKEDINNKAVNEKKSKEEYKVTFIELGSVRCIPCQKMQPIMKSVEEKFAGQVNVVFYDVWTKENKPYADKYKINLIPTQVFLDNNGNEFYRHEGFFPEEELVKVLKSNGVTEK